MARGTVLRVRRATPLVLAIVVLAGCGSSGSSGQRLTRDEYAKRADAICSKYKQKSNALSRPSDLPGLAKIADQVLPLLRSARGELRALRPPQAEQATAAAWLNEFDRLIGDIKKIRDAAQKSDSAAVQAAAAPALQDNQHSNDLASQLGMTVCSKA
jgi:hypothetical protein